MKTVGHSGTCLARPGEQGGSSHVSSGAERGMKAPEAEPSE